MTTSRLALIFLAVSLSSCMTYRGYPDAPTVVVPGAAKKIEPLHYAINGSAMFSGPTAIRDALVAEAPFAGVTPADGEVTQGYYLRVKIEQLSPSIPAVLFGYLSYITLTILPSWSTQDGSVLTFTLYKDGKEIRAKDYIIRRGTFVWIVMLPLLWVNLMTPSEDEAFAAATRDFMAQPS